MKIEIYPEICCDVCNQTIHNHMDCPACGKEYAGTDAYYDLYEDKGYRDNTIKCEDCGAKFKATNTDGWIDEWEWEQLDATSNN